MVPALVNTAYGYCADWLKLAIMENYLGQRCDFPARVNVDGLLFNHLASTYERQHISVVRVSAIYTR